MVFFHKVRNIINFLSSFLEFFQIACLFSFRWSILWTLCPVINHKLFSKYLLKVPMNRLVMASNYIAMICGCHVPFELTHKFNILKWVNLQFGKFVIKTSFADLDWFSNVGLERELFAWGSTIRIIFLSELKKITMRQWVLDFMKTTSTVRKVSWLSLLLIIFIFDLWGSKAHHSNLISKL